MPILDIIDNPGIDTCVGAVEDLKGDSVVYFVRSSIGRHRIVRYYPQSQTSELILEWSGLNFQAGRTVFGQVVDDLLYFTDGYWTPTAWNEPRKLNLTRKTLYSSIKASEPTFVNQLRKPPRYPLKAVRTAVEGTAYNLLTTYTIGQRIVYQNEVYEAITSVPANSILLSEPPPANYWRMVHPDVGTKIARKGAYQFSYRYVYNDHEITPLAPYSLLVPHPANGATTTKFIRITVPAGETAVQSQEVDRIDFYARTGSEGAFVLIRRSKRSDAGGLISTFDFYGPDLAETLADVDQTKLFDSVPVTADDLQIARDRIFEAGYREGYDKPTVDITATYGVVDDGEPDDDAIESQNDRPVYFWSFNGELTNYYVKLDNDRFYGIGSYSSLFGVNGWSGQDSWTLAVDDIGYTEAEFADFGVTMSPYPLTGTQVTVDIIVTATGFSTDVALFKSGSQYQIGIVFYDYGARNSGVYSKPGLLVEVSDRTDTYALFDSRINFSLNSLTPASEIPVWATHYQIVVKRNQTYAFFLQHAMADAYYTGEEIVEGQSELVYTRATRDTDVAIDISNLPLAKLGYIYQVGDRMKIFVDEGITYDVAIKRQVGGRLLVENFPLDTASTIKNYTYEIYTPYTSKENEPYYEVGACYAITNPGLSSRDYSVKAGSLPGDVYVVQRGYHKYETVSHAYDINATDNEFENYKNVVEVRLQPTVTVEAMNPWTQYYSKWYTNAGRTNEDLESKQVYKTRNVRFSNKYVSGTLINGLSSFEALNEKALPVEIGPLKRLILASNAQAEGTVMLAVAENECVSMYLGEAQFRDTQGSTIVAVSGEVIGSLNVLRGGLGTINPESVVYDGAGRVYGWDAVKGEPWRYSADGLTPLATVFQMRKTFYNLSRQLLPTKNGTKVFGGYDAFHKEYLMTFIPDSDSGIEPLTVAFCEAIREDLRGFSSHYSFLPEMYAKSNTLLFSFKNGRLWQHNVGEVHNNFYGVQYKRKITMVANQPVSRMKIWTTVAVEARNLELPTLLSNEKGQESLMRPQWFENREGVWYGAIRRDIHSKDSFGSDFANPTLALEEGAPMRSQCLTIELENARTDASRLDFINVFHIESSNALV